MSGRDIQRLAILIHPLCYEPHRDEADFIAQYADYLEYEQIVKQRWCDRIAAMGEGDALVICGHAPDVEAHAVQHLGDRVMVVTDTITHQPQLWESLLSHEAKVGLGNDLLAMFWRDGFSWDSNSIGQAVIARGWAERILKTCAERRLCIDPAILSVEGWGESFEGCVANYARYLGAYLCLTNPIDVRFEMCVPDARFLFDADLREVIPLGQNVWLYLWQTGDGHIAWFHNAVAQIGDTPLQARFDVGAMRVEVRDNKRLRWPARDSDVAFEAGHLDVPVGDRCFVQARNITGPDFRATMISAKLISEKTPCPPQ
jgi:hypothetical protein